MATVTFLIIMAVQRCKILKNDLFQRITYVQSLYCNSEVMLLKLIEVFYSFTFL